MSDGVPRRAAVTCAALLLAYVASALVGLNRLAWLGAHQGRFYRSYWLFMLAVSLILCVLLWKRVTADVGRAAAAGCVIGYVASCVAGRIQYIQLGLTGPFEAVRHSVETRGVGHSLGQFFLVTLLTGGALFGVVTALLILAIARKHLKLAALLAVLVLVVAATVLMMAPPYARFKHVHFFGIVSSASTIPAPPAFVPRADDAAPRN